MRLPYSVSAVAPGKFNRTVGTTELFHLINRGVHLQLRFCSLFQLTVYKFGKLVNADQLRAFRQTDSNAIGPTRGVPSE